MAVFLQIVLPAVFLCTLFDSVAGVENGIDPNTVLIPERSVTDPRQIFSTVGLPLDFRYNETNDVNKDGIPSAPGCPKSHEGFPWVYYGQPPTCFLVGTQGPCSTGQLLFGNATNYYGVCDCQCTTRRKHHKVVVKEFTNYRFCLLRDVHELNEVAIDIESGRCIFLETQGFCDDGEWAVKDKSGQNVTCVPQCSNSSGILSPYTFELDNRKCIKKISPSIQPVSLSTNIGPQDCEDGMVFSKLLYKCISKSKAVLMKF